MTRWAALVTSDVSAQSAVPLPFFFPPPPLPPFLPPPPETFPPSPPLFAPAEEASPLSAAACSGTASGTGGLPSKAAWTAPASCFKAAQNAQRIRVSVRPTMMGFLKRNG